MIVSIKLKSGEELIGKVEIDSEDILVLSNPKLVHAHMNNEGMQVNLYPFMLSNPTAECQFFQEDIITCIEPDEGFTTYYHKTVGEINQDIAASFGV